MANAVSPRHAEMLIQGPPADALARVGQFALLHGAAGTPVLAKALLVPEAS